MKLLNCLNLLLVACLAVACNQEASAPVSVSVSPTSLLDEIAGSPNYFPGVTHEQMLSSLQQGDLIDIGESHEEGLERDYLAGLYQDLAVILKPLPVECLVETGPVNGVPMALPLKANDQLLAQFEKVCPPDKMFANPVDDYTSVLQKYLPSGRVLTHTGSRHMLPFGLIYPQDFGTPQYVDNPAHGTINRQLPDFFTSSGKQVRSHMVLAFDDLLIPQIKREITTALKSGLPPAQITQAETLGLSRLLASPALQFGPQETAHELELHRVALSFPGQIAYISLLHHAAFDPALLQKLIASPEMAEFLKEVDPNTLQAGALVFQQSDVIGSALISELGTVYFYGNVTAAESGDSKIVFVMISPSQGPSLQYSATPTH